MGQGEGKRGWTVVHPSGQRGREAGASSRSRPETPPRTEPEEHSAFVRRIQKEGIPCFNGLLLRHKGAYGNPCVSFMVPARESEDDGAYYARFYALQSSFLVPFGGAIRAGQYRIFTYALNGEEESVRERLRKGPLDGIAVLRSLVRILQEYSSAQREYYPLQAISPDTVFINPRGDIRILPLRIWAGGSLPVELRTDEVGSSRADVKTDLYSAVYLSMEICSGKFDGTPQMPPSEVLVHALLPHALRPGLEEVSAVLGGAPRPASRGASDTEPPPPVRKVPLRRRFQLWARDIFEPPSELEDTYKKGDVQQGGRQRRSLFGRISMWFRQKLDPGQSGGDEGGTFQKGL